MYVCINEHKGDSLGKTRKAFNDISTVLFFNMPQLQSVEITRDSETLGGQIDRIQHLSAALKADMIVKC